MHLRHLRRKIADLNACFSGRHLIRRHGLPCFLVLLICIMSSSAVEAGTFDPLGGARSAGELALRTSTPLLGAAGKPVPDIDGSAFVLYDPHSRTFLLGENQDEPLPPASITKVMTALLALENMALSDTITINNAMFASIPNDYARLGLVEGEKITVEEALYASLLISANDAAMALAFAMGSSVEGFADMMNERARALGCNNTHFTNPYGYADPDHLTSASDMALITAAALQHDVFREITTKKHALIEPTNLWEEARGLPNGNRFVSSPEFAYEAYIGGKTGYTRLSRYTIVAGAEQEGRELVGVILGASNAPVRYANLRELFDYGFANYRTDPINTTAGTPLIREIVRKIQAEMLQDDKVVTTSTDLQLAEFVTNTRSAGSFLLEIDTSQWLLQQGAADQNLRFPIHCRYEDGSRVLTGQLEIVVALVNKAEPTPAVTEPGETTAVESAADTDNPAATAGRIFLVGLLAAIFLFGLLLLTQMIRRDLNRKRRYKKISRRL